MKYFIVKFLKRRESSKRQFRSMAKLRWILLIFGLLFIAFGAYGLLSQSPLSNVISVAFTMFGATTSLLSFLFKSPLVNSSHQTKTSYPLDYVSSVKPLSAYPPPTWSNDSSSKESKSLYESCEFLLIVVGMEVVGAIIFAIGIAVQNNSAVMFIGFVFAVLGFFGFLWALLNALLDFFE